MIVQVSLGASVGGSVGGSVGASVGGSVGASVGNPWFWTKYSGWDPNVNSYGSIKKKGADMGSYPGARTFKFDLKFTF